MRCLQVFRANSCVADARLRVDRTPDACALAPLGAKLIGGRPVGPITRTCVVLLSADADTRELYASQSRAGGRFEVRTASSQDELPLRSADVAVVQLHPRDDAEKTAGALRARTSSARC